MKNKMSLLIAGLILAAMQAGAQTSSSTSATTSTTTSTSKIGDLQKPTEKMKDIDEEITDARLRASLGSKSKWSLKSDLSYSGGSVNDPMGSIRPNYRASATAEALTYLSGNIGVNVRVGDKDSISFGSGLTINDPFHGDITKPAADVRSGRKADAVLPRYEMSTPYVSWSRGYKAMGTQMSSSLSLTYYTDEDTRDNQKYTGSVSFSQVFLANFGTTKWNGGVSVSLGKYVYSGALTDEYYVNMQSAGKYKRSDISAGLFPFMQYTFNDRYSFRTVFGYFQFSKYEIDDRYLQLEPYQSVGVGISITRDIYLYPNIQFTPKDIRDDRTNVALSTNINLF
ncbi:hypothetical protein AZI86_10600 [Bdellovibrio bacteriovorus]|uniref:Uncharacterized protein n=1 Tax=Bdellovibrio bacteriovorus TaxID=959 RepID=A0A150WL77_BDEBC|nr:hypothetical protein [Bdellovibrio bacteriovorus]KYG64656.1 hypothetical protein AZI86_10600 [Bdellovibrio bacteriovorus]